MPLSGVMIVLPSLRKECSKATGFELVARGDESGKFEIAKSSGEHTPGEVADAAAQLAVSMRPLFK